MTPDSGEVVDRLADRGVVERHDGDAIDLVLQVVECRGQHVAVEDIDLGDADPHPLVGDMIGGHPHPLLEGAHEGIAAARQDELEAMVAAARQPRGKPVRAILQPLDRLLHPFGRIGMHARPAIEHAIDRGQADAGGLRHVLKCRTRH